MCTCGRDDFLLFPPPMKLIRFKLILIHTDSLWFYPIRGRTHDLNSPREWKLHASNNNNNKLKTNISRTNVTCIWFTSFNLLGSIDRFNTATCFYPSQTSSQISIVKWRGLVLCSIIWAELWLSVLLILVD
jgi:hypothetical protein